jgi:hypothetical protein
VSQQSISDFIAAELGEFSGPSASAQFEGDEAAEEFPFMYWKKQDGWIYVGAAWASEYKNRRKIGHQPLDKYGEFLKVNKDGWNSSLEPWRRIFQHPDGPAEFSVQQIRELGWHKKPPYRGVVFPQITEGSIPTELKCPTCGRGGLYSERDLMAHETIAHKDTSTNNALARAIANAQQQGGNTEQLTQIMALLAQGQQQMAEAITSLAGRLDRIDPPSKTPRAEKSA